MIPSITTKIRFPRLGIIRLGEKRTSASGNEYPAKLEYFNLVDALAVKSVYGDKPTTLAPVLFPGNPVAGPNGWDFSSFWKTSRSAYGRGTGLFCRCDDGETATRVHKGVVADGPHKGKVADPQGYQFIREQGLDVEVGELFDMPCPAEECPYWQQKRCKNLGVLDIMLPRVPGFGAWCIRTSSFNSIRNVESLLQSLANATGGIVASIPLVLNLKPQQAQVDGKAVTIYVLELVCPYNLQQLAGLRRRAIASGSAVVAAIDAGDEQVPDDLFPHGGAALDADLGSGPAPAPAGKLAAPAEGGSLDRLANQLGGKQSTPVAAAEDEGPIEHDDPMEELVGNPSLDSSLDMNQPAASRGGRPRVAPAARTPASAAATEPVQGDFGKF